MRLFQILGKVLNSLKFQILKLTYILLSKFRDKIVPEFKMGDYCFFLDRTKRKLVPVKILEVRWEHNENYDIYLKGKYKTLIGYHIVELKVDDNAKLWGKLATPFELVKIKDQQMVEILKLLYDRE